jgi:hypothetical protein
MGSATSIAWKQHLGTRRFVTFELGRWQNVTGLS